MPITVSIVEDVRDTRENLIALINSDKELRFIAAHPTAEIALRQLPLEKPDVAVVDINLPGMSGIDLVSKIKPILPSMAILILTTYQESNLIFNSLRAGASGYLLKSAASADLLKAIREVHAGGAPMSTEIARKVVSYFQQIGPPSSDLEKLTDRETEILTLLAKGHSYKQISETLYISRETVHSHLKHIYEKLQVRSRTEATVKFLGRDPGAPA